MDHFIWKDSFAIGVDEIDGQHKLFLEYVNECYNAACSDGHRAVTDATLYDLETYAATHFSFEEDLMARMGYPDRDVHISQHAYFRQQLADVEQAQQGDNKKTVQGLLQFLRDWFLTHILDHDRKLASFLGAKQPGTVLVAERQDQALRSIRQPAKP